MPNHEQYIKYKKYYEKKADNDHKRNKEDLKNLKVNGCAICGYNECAPALDFHHANEEDKKFTINSYSMTYKSERIIEELNKCILLCANCHRKIHN